MDDAQPQLPSPRQAFYRRERKSVGEARAFTAWALRDWHAIERLDEAVLCVSELATNALLHGVPPGRGFRLHIEMPAPGVVRIEVHDSGDGTVRPGCPDPAAERGRGLYLVAALADRWGVGERDPGKAVWCEFGAAEEGQGKTDCPDPARPDRKLPC
ncbi:ATP-binding protein [Streptomyces sp. cg28]|uniref:ATP-binding protein n=1 Tax=Streptomyces sp. cg28 TaxID=3403457 RepID=UPI003B212F2A